MMSVELNRQYNILPHYTKPPGKLPAIFAHPHPRSLYPTTSPDNSPAEKVLRLGTSSAKLTQPTYILFTAAARYSLLIS